MTLTAFSQIGTKTITQNKDTTIILPKPVAREVVKDLLRYDSISGEYILVKKNYERLENNLILKDSIIKADKQIIGLHEEKEKGYQAIMGYMQNSITTLQNTANQLNKDLKKEKSKRTFWNVVSTVVIGSLLYGLITK